MKKRKQTLNKARDLIMGDRANSYGDAHENHERIAKMWSIVLNKKDYCRASLSMHDSSKAIKTNRNTLIMKIAMWISVDILH